MEVILGSAWAGALYSKNSDRAAGVGIPLFTTALGLYGGVLWSGELQGFIVHERIPTCSATAHRHEHTAHAHPIDNWRS
jgi:hypothetical protein